LPALNLTLFTFQNSLDQPGQQVLTTGAYSDAISGVATPQVSLQPGRYVLVPSTYNAGVTAKFRVVLYSTSSEVRIEKRIIMT